MRERDRFYIAGGGIANRLYFSAYVALLFVFFGKSKMFFSLTNRLSSSIPITILLMFTDVGHEIQHANELVVRLNRWKNFFQVNLTILKPYLNKPKKNEFFPIRLNNGKCQSRN